MKMKIKLKESIYFVILLLMLVVIFRFLYSFTNWDSSKFSNTEIYPKRKPISKEIKTDIEIDEFLISSKMNINKATKEDIMSVDGISEKAAETIIKLRKYHKKIVQIDLIKGIDNITDEEYHIICKNFYAE